VGPGCSWYFPKETPDAPGLTKQVDWERDDLFHLPVDRLLTFLSREVSRHVVIRHDYGLYEYTAYVYKDSTVPNQTSAKRLVDGKRTP
jgi:hypothetical protein